MPDKQPTAEQLLSRLDSIRDGLMILDAEGRVLYLNEQGARLTRRERASLIGRILWDEFQEVGEIQEYREFLAATDGQPRRIESYYPPYDAWYEHDIYPSPEGMISIFREITERKRTQLDQQQRLESAELAQTDLLQQQEELRTLHHNTETLLRIGQSVAAELDLDRLAQRVTDAATEMSGAAFGALFYNVTRPDGESYMLYSLSGVPREAFASFPMPRNTAIFAPTFAGEGVVRLEDVTQDARYGKMEPHRGMPPGHLPVRSYLAAPVVSRSGEVLGGLFFGHPEAGRFKAEHERLVVGIAAQAAVAIDNARLFQEAREAERALRESEERYRCLVEATALVIWRTNAAGELVSDMPGWREITGRTVEETLGKGWLADLHPEDAGPALAEWERSVRTSEPYVVDYRIRSKEGSGDGDYRWLRVRGVPVREEDGSIREWIGACTDVTEARAAEDQLRKEHAFRRAIERSMAAGVSVIDREGRQTYVNPAFTQMVGWSENELLGGTLPYLYWPPEDQAALTAAFEGVVSGSKPLAGLEMKLRRKDDSRFDALVHPAPLREASGEVSGWLVSVYDISERKRAEVERERLLLREQASHREAERSRERAEALTTELEQERDRLAAANAELRSAVGQLGETSQRLREEQEELQTGTRMLRSANKIVSRLATQETVEEMLRLVTDSLRSDMHALCGGIWLFDERGKQLRRAAGFAQDHDFPTSLAEAIEIDLHPYKVAWVARYGRSFIGRILADDLQFDQDWVQRNHANAAALIPLAGRGRTHGVMVAYWSGELPALAAEVLSGLAASLSSALDNHRLADLLRKEEPPAS